MRWCHWPTVDTLLQRPGFPTWQRCPNWWLVRAPTKHHQLEAAGMYMCLYIYLYIVKSHWIDSLMWLRGNMRDFAYPSVVIPASNSVVGSGCGFAVGRHLRAIGVVTKQCRALRRQGLIWIGWQSPFLQLIRDHPFFLLSATGGPLTLVAEPGCSSFWFFETGRCKSERSQRTLATVLTRSG